RSIPDDLLFARARDAVQLHNLSGLEWESSVAAAQVRAAIFHSHPDYLPVGIVVVDHDLRANRILLLTCGSPKRPELLDVGDRRRRAEQRRTFLSEGASDGTEKEARQRYGQYLACAAYTL